MLRTTGQVTIDAARRGILRGRREQPIQARPPGAVAEAEFLERCTRCDACIRACPSHLLARGDGGWPVRDFRAGECDFCAACITACAPAALHAHVSPVFPWGAAIGDHCLGRQGIICHACIDTCSPRALRLRPGMRVPELRAEDCTGCAACVSLCPAGAISMQRQPQPVPA